MNSFLDGITEGERISLEQKLAELRQDSNALVEAELVDARDEAPSDDLHWRKSMAIVAFVLSTGFHSSGIAEKIIKAMRAEGLEEQALVFELVWMKARSGWMQDFMG